MPKERTARIDLRLKPCDKEILERVAQAEGKTVTSLIVEWARILRVILGEPDEQQARF